MLSFKQIVFVAVISALLPLSSCANGPLAGTFQRSLEADPRLLDGASASPDAAQSTSTVELPPNFPTDIPRYPGAQLLSFSLPDSTAASSEPQTVETRWSTSDSVDTVREFYQDILPANNWRIEPPADGATSSAIVAERNGLQLAIALEPSSGESASSEATEGAASPAASLSAGTEFTLSYVQNGSNVGEQRPDSQSANADNAEDAGFVGPVPSSSPSAQASPSASPQTFTDLNQAPEELRQYIQDLARLGVLSSAAGENSSEFKPNEPVTRRDYARWLVVANNNLYNNRPAQKIRLGVSSSDPVFQDVPRTDPDFAAIQGLAEAGLIPSRLSGDAGAVTFRPSAPLTRETLVLWKAPVDTRQTLPNATVQAVQQAWGFQDVNRIDPKALRAVLADHQNGDLSNIRRAFGYTTLFQPKKTVTRAEAAAALWFIGAQGDGISAEDALQAQ